MDPDEVIDCGHGAIEIAGTRINDHAVFDQLTFRDVIAKSSDVGVIRVAQRLGRESFSRYMRDFGFGAPTGVDLPGESRGPAPPHLALERALPGLPLLRPGGRRHRAADDRGRGGGGQRRLPDEAAGGAPGRGRRGTRGEGGQAGGGAPRAGARHRRHADRPAEGRGAQAAPASRAAVPGYVVAGKTGTAQKVDASGRYSMVDHVASFVGFVPASRPALVILVSLDTPARRAQRGRRRGGAGSSRASPSTRCATWPSRPTTRSARCASSPPTARPRRPRSCPRRYHAGGRPPRRPRRSPRADAGPAGPLRARGGHRWPRGWA